jgi:flagellar hook-basal body complex protein FliE
MDITENVAWSGIQDLGQSKKRPATASEVSRDFGQALQESLQEVDAKLKTASMAQQDVAAGGETSIHEAMIAGQKANLSMRFALQIRNKALEAYQEIMRMQV